MWERVGYFCGLLFILWVVLTWQSSWLLLVSLPFLVLTLVGVVYPVGFDSHNDYDPNTIEIVIGLSSTVIIAGLTIYFFSVAPFFHSFDVQDLLESNDAVNDFEIEGTYRIGVGSLHSVGLDFDSYAQIVAEEVFAAGDSWKYTFFNWLGGILVGLCFFAFLSSIRFGSYVLPLLAVLFGYGIYSLPEVDVWPTVESVKSDVKNPFTDENTPTKAEHCDGWHDLVTTESEVEMVEKTTIDWEKLEFGKDTDLEYKPGFTQTFSLSSDTFVDQEPGALCDGENFVRESQWAKACDSYASCVSVVAFNQGGAKGRFSILSRAEAREFVLKNR